MLKIEFYSSVHELLRPFTMARGTLYSKEVLYLIFVKGDRLEFIFELPLSPSMGELPEETLSQLNQKKMSKMTARALSYYRWLVQNKNPIVPREGLANITFDTLSIGSQKLADNGYGAIIRFKGSPDNLKELKEISHKIDRPWSVDFNESLSEEQFTSFLSEADLSHCRFIEQPTASDRAPKNAVPVWADESLSRLTIDQFLASGFTGFMIKPWKFNAEDLFGWLNFAHRHGIPCCISAVAMDTIGVQFNSILNLAATYHQDLSRDESLFKNPFPKRIKTYRLTEQYLLETNPEAYRFIKENYQFKGTLEV